MNLMKLTAKHTSPALTVMICGIKFVPSEHALKSPTEEPATDITELK